MVVVVVCIPGNLKNIDITKQHLYLESVRVFGGLVWRKPHPIIATVEAGHTSSSSNTGWPGK